MNTTSILDHPCNYVAHEDTKMTRFDTNHLMLVLPISDQSLSDFIESCLNFDFVGRGDSSYHTWPRPSD